MTQPKRIAITGAAGQIGYQLAFRIASGQMLGPDQPIILHLLELPGAMPALQGVAMELADCAFNLLTDVIITDNVNIAFEDVDYALLVGSRPRQGDMVRKDLIEINGPIFAAMGMALNDNAAPDVKVLVVGNPANTNALIASSNAPNIPVTNFTAMTRLDHNRAVALIAEYLLCNPADVQRVTIWGNHSDTQFPDLQEAKAEGIGVRNAVGYLWDTHEFVPIVQKRGASIIKMRGASSAASAASAIIDHMRDWTSGIGNEWTSMAVASDGSYGIEPGVFFSFPVRCGSGKYEIIQNINVDGVREMRLQKTYDELLEERAMIEDLLVDENEKLAGDELEALIQKMGGDKLAEAYENVTGKDCGCDKRKEWINNKHKQLKDWWARTFR